MALTPLHVQDVCYGKTQNTQGPWGWTFPQGCKYLAHAVVGQKSVCLCTKLAPSIVKDLKKKGQFDNKAPDNCAGYRYLKHVEQGYDKI